MRLDLAPSITVTQRHQLRELVDSLVADLIDDGALSIDVESAVPETGEALRVVVKSDKLNEPRVVAVKAE